MPHKNKAGAPVADHLYTVTQLGKDLGVTPRTIRFYEDKGLVAPRRAGTTRIYTLRDRARMIIILRGKRLGFTLREIKEYLALYDVDQTQEKQVRMLLGLLQSRIHRLEEQRIALDQTLEELHAIQAEAETALATATPQKATGSQQK